MLIFIFLTIFMKKIFLLILFLLIPNLVYARGWELGLIGILLLLWPCIVFLLTLFIFFIFQLKIKNLENIVLIFFISLNISIILVPLLFFFNIYVMWWPLLLFFLPTSFVIPILLIFKFKNKYLSIIEKQKYPILFQILIFIILLLIFFMLF